MIPECITRAHIAEAIQRIMRDGFPPQRRGRGYCLVADGSHLPPKYTISLAHQVAMGEWLHPGQFSGAKSPMGFFDVVASKSRGVPAAVVFSMTPSHPSPSHQPEGSRRPFRATRASGVPRARNGLPSF